MKYWVCINNEIVGPLEPEKLSAVKGFTMLAWACPQDEAAETSGAERHWKRAISFPELAGCFFPDYPMEARTEPVTGPLEAPPETPELPPGAPAIPPPSPEDAAVIASINRKLDELLKAGPGAAPSLEPLRRDLGAMEKTVESIRDTVSRQDSNIRSGLEPMLRKLEGTSRELEALREQVRQGSQSSSMEPLVRKIDFTEGVMERIKENVEKQEAGLKSELAPLSERVERTEKAVAEESGLQREMLAQITALAQDITEIRNGLTKPPPPPPASPAPQSREVSPPPGAPRGHKLAVGLLSLLLAGGAMTLMYAGLRWALQQASHGAYASPPRRAAQPDPVSFARSFGSPELPLEKAIRADAAARGSDIEGIYWAAETGPDGSQRAVATVRRNNAAPLYYYFVLDLAKKDVQALNRGGARALRAASKK